MDRPSDALPRPLYADILRGRWLPVVGAGLSRNARVPNGKAPPDWTELGAALRRDLTDPDETVDPVEVISAYAHEHGRAALIERVAREIRVADAEPGTIHDALCKLPIDILITTNFDLLLEHSFRRVKKPCHPILDELQLAISNPYPGPSLLKLHGDISRPERMVLTEEDFDRFLLRNPLLATVVASHFAQRSIVLIGYSLSDPDLRQLLGLVHERLGSGARAIYALEVAPSPAKVARFSRRNVRVVSMPGDRNNPAPTLERLFEDLFRAVGEEAPSALIPRTHEGGLALQAAPYRAGGCFLSTSVEGQADYIEWLGPVADRVGVPLLTAFDFVSRGDNFTSALEAMISSAGSAIIEVGSMSRQWELGAAINRLGQERVLVVVPDIDAVPSDLAGIRIVIKPKTVSDWSEFSEMVETWLANVHDGPRTPDSDDARIISIGRVMAIANTLEHTLADRLGLPSKQRSLSRAVHEAATASLISPEDASVLSDFVALRNAVAHGRPGAFPIDARDALLDHVQAILSGIR